VYLQKEVDSLLNEINRVASQTVYNDQVVLDGTHSGQLQVGTENGQNVAFNIKSIDTDTLGLTGNIVSGTTTGGAFVADTKPGVLGTTSHDAVQFASGSTTVVDGAAMASAAAAAGDSMLGLSVLSAADAEQALSKISAAIEQVAGNRAEYGAMSNRLEYTVSNLMNVAEFTTQARSRIEDADFAAESARLSKAQVLQQTGTAMLAQANAASQLAIQLIR